MQTIPPIKPATGAPTLSPPPQGAPQGGLAPPHRLAVLLLAKYLFFLRRRPISHSNLHYLDSRLLGLKSLREALLAAGSPLLAEVVLALDRVHPGGFAHRVDALHQKLLPFAKRAAELPGDVVVVDAPPPPDFMAEPRRVLLVLGPGIGIGDEIIFFPLPKWLREKQPELEITVLTAYRDLWSRVSGVTATMRYTDHAELLRALRGEPPFDGFDLVLLGEFEAPQLSAAIAAEGRLERYVEISLGGRSVVAFDRHEGWLYRVPSPMPYFQNYYSFLDTQLQQLGLHPRRRFEDTVRFTTSGTDTLRLFVTPFTSKYDPSQAYWSHLLAALGNGWGRSCRFVLDIGANSATNRFAIELERSVRARLPAGSTVERARPVDGHRFLSIDGVFSQLANANVVLCSDSFAAHAAAQFGCLTLVVAQQGLEAWRAPSSLSFYFRAEDPATLVAVGMCEILRQWSTDGVGDSSLSLDETRLVEVTRQLLALFEGGPVRQLRRLPVLYQSFVDCWQRVVHRLQPPQQAFLRSAEALPDCLRSLSVAETASGELSPALERHLSDQFRRWCLSNLGKYLQLRAGRDSGESER